VFRKGVLDGLSEQERAAPDKDDVLKAVGPSIHCIMDETACCAIVRAIGIRRFMS
jgi:hypothetical protein